MYTVNVSFCFHAVATKCYLVASIIYDTYVHQVDVCCSDGTFARAAVPSGASTGGLFRCSFFCFVCS